MTDPCCLVQAVLVLMAKRRTCCAVVAHLASLPYPRRGLQGVSKGQRAFFLAKKQTGTYSCLLEAPTAFADLNLLKIMRALCL